MLDDNLRGRWTGSHIASNVVRDVVFDVDVNYVDTIAAVVEDAATVVKGRVVADADAAVQGNLAPVEDAGAPGGACSWWTCMWLSEPSPGCCSWVVTVYSAGQ